MPDPFVFALPGLTNAVSPVSSAVQQLASAQLAQSFLPPALNTPEVDGVVSSILTGSSDVSAQLRSLLTKGAGVGATALCAEIGPLAPVCGAAATFVVSGLADLFGFGTGPSALEQASAEAKADDDAAANIFNNAQAALAQRKLSVLSKVLPMAGGIEASKQEIQDLVDDFYEVRRYGFAPALGKDVRPVWWPEPVKEPAIYPAAYGYMLPFYIIGETWGDSTLPDGCKPPADFVAAIQANPANWRRIYVERIASLFKAAGIDVDPQIDVIFSGHPNPDTSDGYVHQQNENGDDQVYTWRAQTQLLLDVQARMYETIDSVFQIRLSNILATVAVRTKALVVDATKALADNLIARTGCTGPACDEVRASVTTYAAAIASGKMTAGEVSLAINKSLGLDASGQKPLVMVTGPLDLVVFDPTATPAPPAKGPSLVKGILTLAGLLVGGTAVARVVRGRPVVPADWRRPLGR